MTALGAERLAALQIESSTALVRAVPSLSFQPNGTSSFRIRGVGTALLSQGVEPAVALVVDGVVARRGAQGLIDLADIERIEVLRGPQGTLFGKNATAGVINIVTEAPTRQFGGKFDLTVAEGDELRAKASVSGPLGDGVTARLGGFSTRVGGLLKNLNNGSRQYGIESYGMRGKVRWAPSERVDVNFTGDYKRVDTNCCSLAYVQVASPTIRGAARPGRGPARKPLDVQR